MSNFKTVFDFLKDVPKNMNHEEIYLEKVRHANLHRDMTDISMVEWESSVVCHAESNLLCGLAMDNKFTLSGMAEKLPLAAFSLAKQKDDPSASTTKKHKSSYCRKYTTDIQKVFSPARGRVMYPNRPGVSVDRDAVLKGRLQSAMPNLSAQQMGDIILLSVGEKINIPTDMRHVFAKGYLLMCDYNLAAASKHKTREFDPDWGVTAKHNVKSVERMMLMAVYDLVVDADIFTPSERTLLSLMCAEYPTVKYAGDNVYNSIQMEEDKIVWVSDRQVTVDKGYSFGSPDRMYNDMMEIANKMGCLEDMREAFRDMRGLPFIVDKVSEFSGRTVFPMKYPTSYCMRSALGERDCWYTQMTERSNYLSTTKALVAELLLGECFAYSAFAVSEELGAYGRVGCLTGDHVSDPVFNSNCRDYGLKHEDERVNALLQEWRGLKNAPMPIGFRGSLKKYVVNLAAALGQKTLNIKDFCIPPVAFEIPFSVCKNTAWGLVKGYNPKKQRWLDGDEELTNNAKGQAFKFMMGVRDKIPLVGYNSYGARLNEVSSLKETEFDAGGGGEYTIAGIDYYVNCEVTPRTDEMELTALGIHYTRYKGTRCTVVSDPMGEEYIAAEMTEMPQQEQTMGKVITDGEQADSGFQVMTPGGSKLDIRDRTGDLLKRNKLSFASIAKDKSLKVRPLKGFAHDTTGRKIVDIDAEGEAKYLHHKVTTPIREGVFKMTRVPTSGEGLMCGVRAIGQDLVSHGLLAKYELDSFLKDQARDLGNTGMYGAEHLALQMNDMGMGLTVLVPDSRGGGGVVAHNYGTENATHNIVLYNNSGQHEGVPHYENVLLSGDQMMRVTEASAGVAPDESAEAIRQLGLFVLTA